MLFSRAMVAIDPRIAAKHIVTELFLEGVHLRAIPNERVRFNTSLFERHFLIVSGNGHAIENKRPQILQYKYWIVQLINDEHINQLTTADVIAKIGAIVDQYKAITEKWARLDPLARTAFRDIAAYELEDARTTATLLEAWIIQRDFPVPNSATRQIQF